MYPIIRDGPVTPEEIYALRTAVGWDACEGTYEVVLKAHWAHYTVRADGGALVGYMSVLSDGVADAFLLDLMVHPDYRRRRIASAIVRQAICDVQAAGIRALQVTYDERLAAFYGKLGFHLFGGGIIDFKSMTAPGEPDAGE